MGKIAWESTPLICEKQAKILANVQPQKTEARLRDEPGLIDDAASHPGAQLSASCRRCCYWLVARVLFLRNDSLLPRDFTAESLYEAVAQGLAALRGGEWVAGITQGTVKVSVADVGVEHEVKMAEFTKWLDRPGGSPREMIQRQKVRSLLGMPVMRA